MTLKLSKYIEEVAASFAEPVYKTSADIWAAIEIISLIHQRFEGFCDLLLASFMRLVVPPPAPSNAPSSEQKEKEEASRIAKQRSCLRMLTELYLVGIAEDGDKQFIPTILAELFTKDKTQHSNLPICVNFAKFYGPCFLDTKKIGGDVDADVDSKSDNVPLDVRANVAKFMEGYFDSVKKHLLFDHQASHVNTEVEEDGEVNR